MDPFIRQKKSILERPDKSRAGRIDPRIAPVCSFINQHEDYFTTSSCSGRIVVIEPGFNRKKDSSWLFSTHDHADEKEVWVAVSLLPGGVVWFKQESWILHVACRDIGSAAALLRIAQRAGLKRSGMTSLSPKIMVEMMPCESVATVIADKGRLLVCRDYLKILVEYANNNHDRSIVLLDRFFECLRSEM